MSLWCPKFIAAIKADKQRRDRYQMRTGLKLYSPGPYRTACCVAVAAGLAAFTLSVVTMFCYAVSLSKIAEPADASTRAAAWTATGKTHPKKPANVYEERQMRFEPTQK